MRPRHRSGGRRHGHPRDGPARSAGRHPCRSIMESRARFAVFITARAVQSGPPSRIDPCLPNSARDARRPDSCGSRPLSPAARRITCSAAGGATTPGRWPTTGGRWPPASLIPRPGRGRRCDEIGADVAPLAFKRMPLLPSLRLRLRCLLETRGLHAVDIRNDRCIYCKRLWSELYAPTELRSRKPRSWTARISRSKVIDYLKRRVS